MPQLGDILSELREDRNMTQIELSDILHISNSSISAFETGARVPNVETLISLSSFFDVSTDYLLGLTPIKLSPSVLSVELIDGVAVGTVIALLKTLTPEQKSAVLLILKQISFYTDITGKTNRNGADLK